MGGWNAIPAFSSSGTLQLGYRGLFDSGLLYKAASLEQNTGKAFSWLTLNASLTTALNCSGMCCCPNATLAQGWGIQHKPNKHLLKPPRCFSQILGTQGDILDVLPAPWIHSHAGPELREQQEVPGVPSCSAVTKGIMCFNRLLVFYPPPTRVTSGCWRQMAQCSLDLSVGWEKLTLTKEIPGSF